MNRPSPLPPESFRHFAVCCRHPGTVGGDLSCRISFEDGARNKPRGIVTSAIWKITYRACGTTLAPILMSFSRSVVSDQCFTGRVSSGAQP